MPALSQLAISNKALARLPAGQIASVNENSLEARECRRFYPEAVSDFLEGPHDWSFAIRRVALASLALNDRPSEWIYAYAVPANLGSAIRVLPNLEELGLGLPVPLPGQPYAETWAGTGFDFQTPYIIEGSTLYSNERGAVLEYTINDIAGIHVNQLVITALTLDLAARLAVPIKKDSEREKMLLTLAEAAWQRAIADDRNRQPESYGQYVSEVMVARRGYLSEAY